jgi:hypothetical protein
MITTWAKGNTSQWDRWVAHAVYATNIRHQHTNKCSSFELVFGFQPRLPGITKPPYAFDFATETDLATSNTLRLSHVHALRTKARGLQEQARKPMNITAIRMHSFRNLYVLGNPFSFVTLRLRRSLRRNIMDLIVLMHISASDCFDCKI